MLVQPVLAVGGAVVVLVAFVAAVLVVAAASVHAAHHQHHQRAGGEDGQKQQGAQGRPSATSPTTRIAAAIAYGAKFLCCVVTSCGARFRTVWIPLLGICEHCRCCSCLCCGGRGRAGLYRAGSPFRSGPFRPRSPPGLRQAGDERPNGGGVGGAVERS